MKLLSILVPVALQAVACSAQNLIDAEVPGNGETFNVQQGDFIVTCTANGGSLSCGVSNRGTTPVEVFTRNNSAAGSQACVVAAAATNREFSVPNASEGDEVTFSFTANGSCQ